MSRALPILLLGIAAVSFGSVFTRWAEAPSLVIAAYRLGLASLVVGPTAWALSGQEFRRLRRDDLLLALLAGAFLAFHFIFWVASLSYTSVASSVVLVDSHPLFVGLASRLLGLERVSRLTMAGIAISVLGGGLIGYGDMTLGGKAWWGDLLALGGAAMIAGCFLVGRRVRQRLAFLPYISLLYPAAAAVTLALCLLTGQSFIGYSTNTYLMFILLALVPQVIGHSSFYWALGHLSAPFVSVSVLGEPIGATILAFFLLRETPAPLKLAGGTLILAGIYLASRGEMSTRPLQ